MDIAGGLCCHWPLGGQRLPHPVSRPHTLPERVLSHFRELLLRLCLPARMYEAETVSSHSVDAVYSCVLAAHERGGFLRPLRIAGETTLLAKDGAWIALEGKADLGRELHG